MATHVSTVSMGVPRTEFCRQADASLLSGRLVLEVIENHLLRLGGRNHSDNMERLRRFKCHYSVSLVEEEFFELVFLQIDEVSGSPREAMTARFARWRDARSTLGGAPIG